MTWTLITADDESTMPPIGVPVWLLEEDLDLIRPGILLDLPEGNVFADLDGRVEYSRGRWEFYVKDYPTFIPTHWHPFPVVPEMAG